MTSGDPVSWLLIEPGWQVVGREGDGLGRVDELVGDTGKDIFSGLTVLTGVLGKRRFVPAERVRTISEGRVEVDVSKDELHGLDEYEEPPPSEQFRP